jgi:hypothetical protein
MAVFYSFHYDRDYWRVQQILNMGALEGQTILNAQKWEEVKRQGDAAIETWIGEQMAYKSAVVVLIGSQTSTRPWVRREIAKAWDDKRSLLGIQIHGLLDSSAHTDSAGANPFKAVNLKSGGTVGDHVPIYTPTGSTSQQVYASIKANLTTWAANGYKRS